MPKHFVCFPIENYFDDSTNIYTIPYNPKNRQLEELDDQIQHFRKTY